MGNGKQNKQNEWTNKQTNKQKGKLCFSDCKIRMYVYLFDSLVIFTPAKTYLRLSPNQILATAHSTRQAVSHPAGLKCFKPRTYGGGCTNNISTHQVAMRSFWRGFYRYYGWGRVISLLVKNPCSQVRLSKSMKVDKQNDHHQLVGCVLQLMWKKKNARTSAIYCSLLTKTQHQWDKQLHSVLSN